MKRDMDLIRDLILRIENDEKVFDLGPWSETRPNIEASDQDITRHLEMLAEEGWIEIQFLSLAGAIIVRDLTWKGHDFAVSIRESAVWEATKSAAKKGGVETVEFMWTIAKAVLKKRLADATGLELG